MPTFPPSLDLVEWCDAHLAGGSSSPLTSMPQAVHGSWWYGLQKQFWLQLCRATVKQAVEVPPSLLPFLIVDRHAEFLLFLTCLWLGAWASSVQTCLWCVVQPSLMSPLHVGSEYVSCAAVCSLLVAPTAWRVEWFLRGGRVEAGWGFAGSWDIWHPLPPRSFANTVCTPCIWERLLSSVRHGKTEVNRQGLS